jgi:hypothetical protein
MRVHHPRHRSSPPPRSRSRAATWSRCIGRHMRNRTGHTGLGYHACGRTMLMYPRSSGYRSLLSVRHSAKQQFLSPGRLRSHRWQEDNRSMRHGKRGCEGATTEAPPSSLTLVCHNVLHSLTTALYQRPQTPKKISMMYIPVRTEVSQPGRVPCRRPRHAPADSTP